VRSQHRRFNDDRDFPTRTIEFANNSSTPYLQFICFRNPPHAKKEQLVQRRSGDAAQTQTKSGVVMLRKIDCKVDVVELAAGDDTRQRLPEV
jgi:hypothetical protein